MKILNIKAYSNNNKRPLIKIFVKHIFILIYFTFDNFLHSWYNFCKTYFYYKYILNLETKCLKQNY